MSLLSDLCLCQFKVTTTHRMPIKNIQHIQGFLSKHKEFFIIFLLLTLIALITRPGTDSIPTSHTEIEIDNLPRIYQSDTTHLQIEISYVKPQKNKKIPSSVTVNFHTFNYHPSKGKWYLTKYDIASLLPDFTILKINPDTLWFSPWFSAARKVPVVVNTTIPHPFELISLHLEPDSIPLLYRPSDGANFNEIHLGTIRLKNDRRHQTFTLPVKKYLPKGTHSNVKKITIRAEIGHWKPTHLLIHTLISDKSYLAHVYLEIPVDDHPSDAQQCIQIIQTPQGDFQVNHKPSTTNCRIRNLKLIGINAIDG
ncbi:hypothetical protein [Schleiferia thermophila]|uniref:hypothetical protein n=2 Tax=Schleiferia thermophila TaxID=884107 RepID=UPI0012684F9D